jgi:hypothetical protein
VLLLLPLASKEQQRVNSSNPKVLPPSFASFHSPRLLACVGIGCEGYQGSRYAPLSPLRPPLADPPSPRRCPPPSSFLPQEQLAGHRRRLQRCSTFSLRPLSSLSLLSVANDQLPPTPSPQLPVFPPPVPHPLVALQPLHPQPVAIRCPILPPLQAPLVLPLPVKVVSALPSSRRILPPSTSSLASAGPRPQPPLPMLSPRLPTRTTSPS